MEQRTRPQHEPEPPAGSRHERLSAREFAERFRESSRVLWCIAAGVVNDRSLADDILQEAAMVGLDKLDQFDAGTSFLAWAGQIVRFVALNEGRKGQRRRALHDEAARSAPTETASVRDLGRVDSAGRVAPGDSPFDDDVTAALAELDDVARSCLLLKTTLDLAYADISRILGIPEGTAMSHVHRARKAMRQKLVERGHHAARPGGTAERGGA